MQTPQKIAVVGSGLVGTLLAIYLKRQGHTVHVYDRSSDIRTVEFSGRSINLVMSNRGWKAMEDVGLDDEILDPPAWLSDEAVRHGICLQLEVDRCMEEEARLMQERAVIQEWMLAEWESIQVALNDAGT